jgi:hypothetical protein
MSYEDTLKSISLDADASLGIYTGVPGRPGSAVPNQGKQYCLVKVTGVHQVGLCTGGADTAVGVMQNKPQVPGQAATVGFTGVTNVISGAAFAAGVVLTSDGVGRAVAGGTGTGKKLISMGIASGADELVPAMFI